MLQRFFEHHGQPLLPRQEFLWRLAKSALAATGILGSALGIGVWGYHHFEGLPWIDALLEASMILGGMGPIRPPTTNPAKLFASFYALFSGVVFLTSASVLIAPVLHRMLHWLHQGREQSAARDRQ
jgi:hypothetical protein